MYRLENELPCSHRVALKVSPLKHMDIPLTISEIESSELHVEIMM